MKIMIKNAKILTLDPDDRMIDKGDIVVDGSRISAIGENLDPAGFEPPERVIDGSGLLAMPGLINSHFHSESTFMKGAFEGLPLELYMLYETPTDEFSNSNRVGYLRSALSAIEFLKQGVTAVRDDRHFFLPATGDAVDSTFQAYEDAGIRASVGIADPNVPLYDTLPFMREMLSDQQRRSLDDRSLNGDQEVLEIYRRAFSRWHGRGDNRLMVHASCSAPQRVTKEVMQELSRLASEHDVSFDMHILETKMQYVHGKEVFGQSLIAYADEIGALTENSVVIHAVWADGGDLERLARRGAVVAHNPVSNLKLGSGVMSMRDMMSHGIPVCLGTDEHSVDDGNNLWIVAKIGAMLQTLDKSDCDLWPKAADYLHTICHGGARAFRLSGRLGMLAEGCYADLILLDLNNLPFVPLNDLKRQLVFGETGSSVVMTIVGGRIVYENGEVLSVDEAAIKGEIKSIWSRYRAYCDAFNRKNRDLGPVVRSIYDKCAGRSIGFSRWIGG